MPLYEYTCRECDTDFEMLTSAGKRDSVAACPSCGADKVLRKISLAANAVIKSGKSGGSSEPYSCGSSSCCGGSCALD
ncbi:MAG: FmdB family zinc ribbon protein [Capsulimonadaceae bacterium]